MVFAEGSITFKEFAVKETLPLSAIQDAVLEFLQGRDDAVVFGAQAVNAYVDEPRMTQEVDILSDRASELAEELREYLHDRFRISIRVRTVKGGQGYRLYQARKPKSTSGGHPRCGGATAREEAFRGTRDDAGRPRCLQSHRPVRKAG